MNKANLHCELRGNENQNLYFGPYMHNMHFILFSEQDGLKVFQEWNSWGYYARSFFAVDQKEPSKKYTIQRRQGMWEKNFPATHTLNHGEFLITDIDFCNGTWKVVPKLPKENVVQLIITPQFQNKVEKDDDQNTIWSGEVKGAPRDITLEKTCLEELNSDQGRVLPKH